MQALTRPRALKPPCEMTLSDRSDNGHRARSWGAGFRSVSAIPRSRDGQGIPKGFQSQKRERRGAFRTEGSRIRSRNREVIGYRLRRAEIGIHARGAGRDARGRPVRNPRRGRRRRGRHSQVSPAKPSVFELRSASRGRCRLLLELRNVSSGCLRVMWRARHRIGGEILPGLRQKAGSIKTEQ